MPVRGNSSGLSRIRLEQPLSQLSEGNTSSSPSPDMEHENFNVRTLYTPSEMDTLFQSYVAVSEDSVVGTSQAGRRFWERIVTIYNAKRPDGTRARNASMLSNAFGRASEEIQKFQGFYLKEMRTASGCTSEADFMTGAMLAYQTMTQNPFKHIMT